MAHVTRANTNNNGADIVTGLSIVGFLATVIVALRFWARHLTRNSFKLDDWLCLAALLFQHALLAASAVAVIDGGLGRTMSSLSSENIIVLFQAIFVGEIAYTYSSPLIKLSVLAFYRSIFPTKIVRLGTLIIAIACILWCIPITILNFAQCRPLKAFWYVELQALPTTKCINSVLAFYGNSIVNTIIDFSTILLPVHDILKLHTTTRRKINISLVFLLGGLALAASLVRTISTASLLRDQTDFSKQFAVSAVATVIEIYAAIIGACLPVLVPIYRKLRYGDPLASQSSSRYKRNPTNADSLGYGSRGSHWKQLNNHNTSFDRHLEATETLTPNAYQGNHRVKICSDPADQDLADSHEGSYPLTGVMVRQDTVWTETHGGRGHS